MTQIIFHWSSEQPEPTLFPRVEANRAHELDPLSPIFSHVVGGIHIFAGRYDEGIVVLKNVANGTELLSSVPTWETMSRPSRG